MASASAKAEAKASVPKSLVFYFIYWDYGDRWNQKKWRFNGRGVGLNGRGVGFLVMKNKEK